MLGLAGETPYDLRFRLLRIPVRVHPLFWLFMLLFSGAADVDLKAGLVFVACGFISILLHELGHALSGRLMGDEPADIVLHSMGGYCTFFYNHLTRWRRIVMLACGPGVGFVLFGLLCAYLVRSGYPRSRYLGMAVGDLIYINLWWGLFNLLPLWPLDGGQILGVALGMFRPSRGMLWTHRISFVTAMLLGLLALSGQNYWMLCWFGYFGYVNYEIIREDYPGGYSVHSGGRRG